MLTVTAAIANSIKINVQSIFKQYTKCQQPMNAKLASVHSASTCKAFRVYKQSEQCQRPTHTLSTTNERNINAQSINNQCALHQQPMRIASDFLMLGFSSPNTFTLCSMPLTPVILRGAEGEVAESILPESTLSQGVWRDRP